MAEPTTYAEYLQRFQENNKITGLGLNVQVHCPCPFCAAPDFSVYKVTQAQQGRHDTCKECGRSLATVVERSALGNHIQMAVYQTDGPDQPEWLQPPIPRARPDLVIPLPPTTGSTAHDHDVRTANAQPIHFRTPTGDGTGHSYRACSWCGSAHPKDIADGLRAGEITLSFADWKYGWPHKAYVGGDNPKGYIKFYSVHLMDAAPEDKVEIERALRMRFDFRGEGNEAQVVYGPIDN